MDSLTRQVNIWQLEEEETITSERKCLSIIRRYVQGRFVLWFGRKTEADKSPLLKHKHWVREVQKVSTTNWKCLLRIVSFPLLHHSLIFQQISICNHLFQPVFEYIQLFIAIWLFYRIFLVPRLHQKVLSPLYVYIKVDQILFSAFKKKPLFLETAQAKNMDALFTWSNVLQTVNAQCLPKDAKCIFSYQKSHRGLRLPSALLIFIKKIWLTFTAYRMGD